MVRRAPWLNRPTQPEFVERIRQELARRAYDGPVGDYAGNQTVAAQLFYALVNSPVVAVLGPAEDGTVTLVVADPVALAEAVSVPLPAADDVPADKPRPVRKPRPKKTV
jgi:hypothetical protein